MTFKTIKELEAEMKEFYKAHPEMTMDIRDIDNQFLGYKTALKDVLGLIDEMVIEDDYMSIDTKQACKELKARMTGK